MDTLDIHDNRPTRITFASLGFVSPLESSGLGGLLILPWNFQFYSQSLPESGNWQISKNYFVRACIFPTKYLIVVS